MLPMDAHILGWQWIGMEQLPEDDAKGKETD